ncbi:ATP-dependent DNA helicase [Abeliophyllum distichum]|uniref:ATP-dependent DNA helicase n=1 Tax=Abeliophyllum distichum TaxID=126358 RepID=A0ABD1SE71_9LAMI
MNPAESCSKVCEPTLLTKKQLQNKRRRELYAQTKEARNTRKKELCREVGELRDKRRKERHSQRKEQCGNHSKQLRMKQLNHNDIVNTVCSGDVSYNDIPTTSNHNNDHANRCGLFEPDGEEQLPFKMCEDGTENIHMNDSGRLLQQYVVDMYIKVETSRLDYFRNNQSEIRAELYQGIVDSLETGECSGARIGKIIVLPSSFTGGPRDMQKRFNDAMALVQRFDDDARKLLYKEFPEHFVWNKQSKYWTRRKKFAVIARIAAANPIQGERYYLRLLLNHVRGPKSFQSLKYINGLVVESFREAALLRGLLHGDNDCELCLQEASTYQMPHSLRRLFSTILVFCSPNNPKQLWNQFRQFMIEDYIRKGLHCHHAEVEALKSINSFLEPLGKSLNDYELVNFDVNVPEAEMFTRMVNEELATLVTEDDISCVDKLNKEQKLLIMLS